MYDSMYRKCEEKANVHREKVDEQLPGAGRGNRV